MNNLSWLLYWADVLPNISTWLGVTSFFVMLLFAVCFACSFDYDFAPAKQTLRRIACFTPIFFVLWGCSFLVPSKQTFYMIAASEAGGQVLQTPEFSKLRGVINKYLDEELSNDKKKDDE